MVDEVHPSTKKLPVMCLLPSLASYSLSRNHWNKPFFSSSSKCIYLQQLSLEQILLHLQYYPSTLLSIPLQTISICIKPTLIYSAISTTNKPNLLQTIGITDVTSHKIQNIQCWQQKNNPKLSFKTTLKKMPMMLH